MTAVAWTYHTDVSAALEHLADVRTRATGPSPERAVRRLSALMQEAAVAAFGEKREPRYGRPWEAPSPLTTADVRFRSLLERTGELRRSLRGRYRVGPGIATAALALEGDSAVVRRGMIHLYGVKASGKRSNRAYRRRPGASLPARRFVGFPKSALAEIIADLKADLGAT